MLVVNHTVNTEETKEIAKNLAKNCSKGDIICLCGDLGVGKTVFAKGFARGLGITDNITSPTFSIINIYNGDIPFYHFDVYRIANIDEMYDTGYEDYFYGEGICLVEWADMIKDIIPENAVWVEIFKDLSINDDYRKIIIKKNNY